MPDKDRDRYVVQAQREAMSLSAWLRAAAEDRVQRHTEASRFETVEDLQAFFSECDERSGVGVEPDWEQHRQVIDGSRGSGAAGT